MNTMVEYINSAGFSFVEFALPMLIQSSVLIVILLLADLLLRKKVKAVFRYWIWMLVLAKLILPASLSSPLSLGYLFGDKLTYQDLAQTTSALESAKPAPADISPGINPIYIQPNAFIQPTVPVIPGVEQVAAEPVSPPEVSVTPLSWQGVVFLVWLAVVIAMGLLLLQRALFVRGLVTQAKKASRLMSDELACCCASMKIKRKIGLKVSPNATTPSVCGLIRPVILVPWNLVSTLGASRLRTVLMHELAHIRRGDLWVNLAQTILQIIYFYNPLLWLANCVIRRIREQAVDEAVLVAMGAKAQKYPQTLVDVAKLAFKRPALSLRLIGVVESKSALAGRIKHILGRPMPKTAKLGIVGVLAILIAGAILLPMAKAEKDNEGAVEDIAKASEFMATLPNDVTVELMGVCELPGQSKQWWAADGSLLEDIFWEGSTANRESSVDARQVVFRIRSDESDPALVPTISFQPKRRLQPPGSWSGAFFVEKDNQTLEELRGCSFSLHDDQKSIDISADIGYGPWKTLTKLAMNSDFSLPKPVFTDIGYLTWNEPTEEGGKTTVSATLFDAVKVWRIVAVDKQGDIHVSNIASGQGFDGHQIVKSTFSLPLSRIEKFRFQTRPFGKITFKNVSLEPNFKTDVQVEVDRTRAEPVLDGVIKAAKAGISMPVRKVFSGKTDKGGSFEWETSIDPKVRFRHGWYSVEDGVVREHVGASASRNPEEAKLNLKLDVEVKDNILNLKVQRVHDLDDGSRTAAVASKTSVPAGAYLKHDSSIDSDVLTDKHLTLWRGDFIRDGKVVKSVIYAAYLTTPDDRETGFKPPVLQKAELVTAKVKSDVRFGIERPEVAGWEDIGKPIPADFNDTIALTEKITLGSIGRDVEGKSFITFVWDKEKDRNRQYRFVLIKNNDTVLEPDSHLILDGNGRLEEKFTFDETYVPWRLKEFKFQSRPLPLAGTQSISSQLQKDTSTAFEGKTISPSKQAPPGRYAIELDGVDDYLLVPDSPTLRLDPPFTVEMWIKPKLPEQKPDRVQEWGVIAQGGYVGTGRAKPRGFGIELIRFEKEPAKFNVSYHEANDSGLFGKDYGRYRFDEWMHISHVFEGENYKPGLGHPLVVGKFLIPMPEPFMGQIGEIRIWNSARKREEIRRYRDVALTGKEPGLAACWTFEQGEGRFAYDMSGNNNHARLGKSIEADDADPKWVDLEAASPQPGRIADVQVEAARAEKTASQQLSFGPVTERVLSFNFFKDSAHLDLDTGRYGKEQTGRDVIAAAGESDGRVRAGLDMVAIPVEARRWESSPQEVLDEVAKGKRQRQARLGGPESRRTFFFKTREDSVGVLQILPLQDSSSQVKVRYKLVKMEASKKTDVPGDAEGVTVASAESEVTAGEDGPRITFENLVCDLGRIPPRTKHICEFKFTNTGNDVLVITKVRSACACATSIPQKKKGYAPGESGTLKVTYRSDGRAGPVTKSVFVDNNTTVNPVKLTIKAEIVVKVAHEPKKLSLVLDKENAGCPAITLSSLDNKPFAITGFKSTGGNSVTVDFDPSLKETSFVIQPKVDIEKLRKSLRGQIEIGLTHPECKKLTITYDTLAEFKFDPRVAYVRNAEPQKPVTKKVWIFSNYNKDFEIESTSSKKGTVKVLTQQKVRDGFQLELQITPPVPQTNRRVFTDVFFAKIKGGEELQVTCYGIYSKKPAETTEVSIPKTDAPVDVEEVGEKVSQLMGADLPDSVQNVKFHSGSFEFASKTWIRFDMPLSDLKNLLVKSDMLPDFQDLHKNPKIQKDMDAVYKDFNIQWWKSDELESPVCAAWVKSERVKGAPKVWVVNILNMCCSQLKNNLMRIYISLYSDSPHGIPLINPDMEREIEDPKVWSKELAGALFAALRANDNKKLRALIVDKALLSALQGYRRDFDFSSLKKMVHYQKANRCFVIVSPIRHKEVKDSNREIQISFQLEANTWKAHSIETTGIGAMDDLLKEEGFNVFSKVEITREFPDTSPPNSANNSTVQVDVEGPGKNANMETQPLSFGPVVNCVVHAIDTEKDSFVDFDTGKYFNTPKKRWLLFDFDMRNLHHRVEWAKKTGADAAVRYSTGGGGNLVMLWSYDVAAKKVEPDNWQDLRAEQVVQYLSKATHFLEEDLGHGHLRQEPPDTTHIFKTREGGVGIIQIVGFTNNPMGVKIRYKMVQKEPARKTNVLQVGGLKGIS